MVKLYEAGVEIFWPAVHQEFEDNLQLSSLLNYSFDLKPFCI